MDFKILYIAGTGRSGSTITDVLLGQSKDVSSFGELINLFKSGWINNEFCSCGKSVNECEFWRKVREEWEDENSLTVNQYLQLQNKYTKLRYLLLLWKNSIYPSKEFICFKKSTITLFKVISRHMDSKVILDSSKSPIWMYALKIMGFNLNVLHLVRDGRGVTNSLKKHFTPNVKQGVQKELKPKSTIRTALFWIITNLLVVYLKNESEYMLVKYEELLNNWEEELNQIGDKFKIDVSIPLSKVKNREALEKGHTVAGNRLRMRDDVVVKTNQKKSWDNLSKNDIRIFNFIAGWLLKKYNYKL